MQRKLFIIRHGKSSWESIVADIDRPLTEKGVKDAGQVAEILNQKNLRPEAIYSSPANRALHTAIIMARAWGLADQHIHISNDLYLPEPSDILRVISGISDERTSVAIYGHNPGFTQFANRFMEEPVDNVPTAGTVIVTLELDSWTDLVNASVTDVVFEYPKKYR